MSWDDLEVLSLLIFERLYLELVTVTLKYLVELTAEASWTWAFLLRSFLITNLIFSLGIGLFQFYVSYCWFCKQISF